MRSFNPIQCLLVSNTNCFRFVAYIRDIVELLAKRMGDSLVDDPLRHTGHFKDMVAVQEAIAKGFVNSLRGQRFAWQLQLCRRIMRHLPEDNLTYHALLCMMIDHAFLDRSRPRSLMLFNVVRT